MKKIFLIIFLSISLFASEIKIAVAANVSYALDELIGAFNEIYPNVKVIPIISSSGNLFAQIRHNAPFGIFMSADMKYPQKLYELGLSATKPVVYAQGSLAIVCRKNIDFTNDLKFLENLKSIAIANPDIAPYGKASVEALKKAKVYEKVKNKIIFGQNISQTFTYALNATDVGFVAKSALFSPKLKNTKLYHKDVNTSLYEPINQGTIILYKQKDDKDIKAFYDFILSKKAKDIFKKYGYLVK